MEAKKAPVPNTVETGEEIPLRAGHKHSSRESFQLDGLPPQLKKAQLVRREREHAALPER